MVLGMIVLLYWQRRTEVTMDRVSQVRSRYLPKYLPFLSGDHRSIHVDVWLSRLQYSVNELHRPLLQTPSPASVLC